MVCGYVHWVNPSLVELDVGTGEGGGGQCRGFKVTGKEPVQ